MQKRMLTTFLVVLAAGCGVSKDEFAAAQRDAEQNLKNYQAEAQKSAALEKKVADLQKQNQELTTTSAKLEQEKGVAEAKSAQYEQLAGSLQNQIASGQIEISELKGKMTVKLKDKVLFASGSTALNKEGKAALNAVADAFKGLHDKNVIVAGYTDDVPTGKSGFKDNWDLSCHRSIAVKTALHRSGVSQDRIGVMGYGEFRPREANPPTGGDEKNRRVEIFLVSSKDSFAAPGVASADNLAGTPRKSAAPAREGTRRGPTKTAVAPKSAKTPPVEKAPVANQAMPEVTPPGGRGFSGG